MFAFDRSAIAVLAPLALLLAVVLWSQHGGGPAVPPQAQADAYPGPGAGEGERRDQTVAANLPSR
jgi:hypothetical protein